MHPSGKLYVLPGNNRSHGGHVSLTIITTEHVMSYSKSVQMLVLSSLTPEGNVPPSSLLRGVCGGSKAGCTPTVPGRANKA